MEGRKYVSNISTLYEKKILRKSHTTPPRLDIFGYIISLYSTSSQRVNTLVDNREEDWFRGGSDRSQWTIRQGFTKFLSPCHHIGLELTSSLLRADSNTWTHHANKTYKKQIKLDNLFI